MKLEKIEKISEGRFITRYNVSYRLNDGRTKVYEMISRDRDIEDIKDLKGHGPDSVIIIMENETGDKLLLSREFRMPIGDWVINFPAGLIDEGESPLEAAARELREETGLKIKSVSDVIGNSYSAIGFSNESNVCVIGTAEGEFSESTAAEEEIEPGWYTKEQVRELLRSHKFAARTQAYCYMWSRE